LHPLQAVVDCRIQSHIAQFASADQTATHKRGFRKPRLSRQTQARVALVHLIYLR